MTPHQHIALFTDFGFQDAYVAQMKGAILSINPSANLLDLSHLNPPFELRQTSYLLEQSTRLLPAGTIVVAVVDPGVGSNRHPIGLQTEAHKYYIGPDNGLFTRVVQSERVRAAHLLQNSNFFLHQKVSTTFHGRDIFAPVAAHLSLGVELQSLGPALSELVSLPFSAPRIEGRTVRGEVIHIDHYGNIITNITQRYLEHVKIGSEIVVNLADTIHRIPFCSTYSDAKPGQLICLVNSDEAFELALPLHNAAAFLGIKGGEMLTISN